MKYLNKIVLLLILFITVFCFYKPPKVINYTFISFLTRYEINDKIKQNKNYYIKLYGEHFNRKDIAKEVINASLDLNMPIHISFAVGLAESSLNHSASRQNKNGSFDYGVFQLNSKTYPDIKTFSKLENNVRQGILHLKDELGKHNSIDVAIMTYNSGSINNIGKTTINHLKRVLEYEKALDEWFNSKYWSSFYRNTD